MRHMVLALTLLAAPALADSDLPAARWANEQLPDPRQEAQAKALMEELRCLVCQGQSIADSDAELAGDMRALVRQRIAAGEKPDQVRAW
ncbi:MAG TPA: cytochrome c-type biogenesis protein, partial [Sphingomicrobium sp.]|nr:cytochrome c-type biogenesis protein [Sphingomicrobium sp.]